MAKFVEPAKEVDAIQYTRQPGGTLRDIFQFAVQASLHVCSAIEEISAAEDSATTYRLWIASRPVNLGDWIVLGGLAGKDSLAIIPDKDFRAKYKPAEVIKCKSPEPAIIGGPGVVSFVLDPKDGWIRPNHAR